MMMMMMVMMMNVIKIVDHRHIHCDYGGDGACDQCICLFFMIIMNIITI
jgi:hypothetical protein